MNHHIVCSFISHVWRCHFYVLTGAQWAQALALLEELEKQLVEANAVPWPHVIPKMEGFEVGRLAGGTTI